MKENQIRVLYVDDDPDDFYLVEKYLRRVEEPGYSLDHAFSYEEALTKINESYDIFLVDYRLGKVNGLELIKEIKSRQTHAAVILLTGMTSRNLDREALLLGASDYLIKGEFDASTLDRTIRYALRDSEIKVNLNLAGEKFKSIFELASDPFLLIDRDSAILEVNPSSIAKFEFEVEITQKSKMPLFASLIEEQELQKQLLKKLQNKFEIIDFEATLINKAGKKFKGLVNIVKQNENTFQVLIKDLSAIKAKEEEDLNLKNSRVKENVLLTGTIIEGNVLSAGLEKHGLKQDRRSLRLIVNALEHNWLADDVLELSFSLKPGSYATSVLQELGVFTDINELNKLSKD
jgi:PAS domain S-box-containing protein